MRETLNLLPNAVSVSITMDFCLVIPLNSFAVNFFFLQGSKNLVGRGSKVFFWRGIFFFLFLVLKTTLRGSKNFWRESFKKKIRLKAFYECVKKNCSEVRLNLIGRPKKNFKRVQHFVRLVGKFV